VVASLKLFCKEAIEKLFSLFSCRFMLDFSLLLDFCSFFPYQTPFFFVLSFFFSLR